MIGFFGGTFDPIHLGHLNLAISLKEQAHLDEVWLCPAYLSPLKVETHSATVEDRLEMCRLAVKDIPGFKVLDIEVKRRGPSYTIDTLRELIKTTGKSFRLILGADKLKELPLWKESEALIALCPPLVGGRGDAADPRIVSTPLFDVSATEVRNRIKEGLYVSHLLPQPVLNYILNQGLYRNGRKS